MKISPATISILKNYATINQSLLIKEGNIIATQDGSPTILARAIVEETFPVNVAIYDLHQFLGTLAMMGECEVEFGKKSVVLTANAHSTEYFYAEPTLIRAASEKTLKGGEFFTCTLSEKDVTMALKAAAVFSAPTLSFVGEEGEASLRVGDFKTPSTNGYRRELGACDKNFDFRIPIETMKIVPDSYTVELSEQKFVHFQNNNRDLQYWLAVDPTSRV